MGIANQRPQKFDMTECKFRCLSQAASEYQEWPDLAARVALARMLGELQASYEFAWDYIEQLEAELIRQQIGI